MTRSPWPRPLTIYILGMERHSSMWMTSPLQLGTVLKTHRHYPGWQLRKSWDHQPLTIYTLTVHGKTNFSIRLAYPIHTPKDLASMSYLGNGWPPYISCCVWANSSIKGIFCLESHGWHFGSTEFKKTNENTKFRDSMFPCWVLITNEANKSLLSGRYG